MRRQKRLNPSFSRFFQGVRKNEDDATNDLAEFSLVMLPLSSKVMLVNSTTALNSLFSSLLKRVFIRTAIQERQGYTPNEVQP